MLGISQMMSQIVWYLSWELVYFPAVFGKDDFVEKLRVFFGFIFVPSVYLIQFQYCLGHGNKNGQISFLFFFLC